MGEDRKWPAHGQIDANGPKPDMAP